MYDYWYVLVYRSFSERTHSSQSIWDQCGAGGQKIKVLLRMSRMDLMKKLWIVKAQPERLSSMSITFRNYSSHWPSGSNEAYQWSSVQRLPHLAAHWLPHGRNQAAALWPSHSCCSLTAGWKLEAGHQSKQPPTLAELLLCLAVWAGHADAQWLGVFAEGFHSSLPPLVTHPWNVQHYEGSLVTKPNQWSCSVVCLVVQLWAAP